MVDLDKLRAELAGFAPGAQRCKLKIETADYNGYVSFRYYACQLIEGHAGPCSAFEQRVLLWPGYETMRALVDELATYRANAQQ